MTDNQDEITLQMLLDYQTLHKKVEDFLRTRCRSHNLARKSFDGYEWRDDEPADDLMGFEIFPEFIEVYFQDNLTDFDPGTESYELPLDSLFNDDFYKIMAAKYTQMKKEHDALTETEKRNSELKLLEELKRKYEGEN